MKSLGTSPCLVSLHPKVAVGSSEVKKNVGVLLRVTTTPKHQSLGVVLPARVYYRYAQISAVGREK